MLGWQCHERQQKNQRETLYFIDISIINRTLHEHLKVRIIFLVLSIISRTIDNRRNGLETRAKALPLHADGTSEVQVRRDTLYFGTL